MKTLGILGTGTMGAGIAQIGAQAGYSVLFWNRKPASVEKGVATVKKGPGACSSARRSRRPTTTRRWRGCAGSLRSRT
jgi:3-hydroxyacyl-CoA dehydrogenase